MKRVLLLLVVVAVMLGSVGSVVGQEERDPEPNVSQWWGHARIPAEHFEAISDIAESVARTGMAPVMIELTNIWLEYSETAPSDEQAFAVYMSGHEYMYYKIQLYKAWMLERPMQGPTQIASIAEQRYIQALIDAKIIMRSVALRQYYHQVPSDILLNSQ